VALNIVLGKAVGEEKEGSKGLKGFGTRTSFVIAIGIEGAVNCLRMMGKRV
jgi:hypothetical protein